MGGEDGVPEDGEAYRRREEGCRREEAIRSLLKRHDDKRLNIGAVDSVAQELGVSRSTMYRLITAYRAEGTVSSVEPRALGLPISFRPALLAGVSRTIANPAILDAVRDETILRGRRAFERLCEAARLEARATRESHQM
jgi:hypothetical protein